MHVQNFVGLIILRQTLSRVGAAAETTVGPSTPLTMDRDDNRDVLNNSVCVHVRYVVLATATESVTGHHGTNWTIHRPLHPLQIF
jgi:hypothetical protein